MAIDDDDNESGDTIVVRFIFDHECCAVLNVLAHGGHSQRIQIKIVFIFFAFVSLCVFLLALVLPNVLFDGRNINGRNSTGG